MRHAFALIAMLPILGFAASIACEPEPAPAAAAAPPPSQPGPPAPPEPAAVDPVDPVDPDSPDAWPERVVAQLGSASLAHSEPILDVAWAGELVVTLSRSGASVWEGRSGWRLAHLEHTGTDVALAPTGEWVAIAHETSSAVSLWRPGDEQPVRRIEGGLRGVTAVAFSPDADTLALASSIGQLDLVSAASGEARLSVTTGRRGPEALAFDSTGARVAIGGGDGVVQVLEAADGSTVAELGGDEEQVTAVAFSPSGRLVAVAASTSRDIVVYEVASGEVWATLQGHRGAVTDLAFVPGSERLVTTGLDQTVRRWDLDTARELEPRLGPWAGGGVVRFSDYRLPADPAGSHLSMPRLALDPSGAGGLLTGWGHAAVAFSWPDGALTLRPGGQGPVTALSFSPDGGVLATGNRDGALALWSVDQMRDPTGGEPTTGEGAGASPIVLSGHLGAVLSVELDARTVRSRTRWTERRWDRASGRPLSASGGHFAAATSLAFDDAGRIVLGDYGRVLVLDPETGLEHLVVLTSGGHVASLAAGAAGGTVALTREDRRATLVELSDGASAGTLPDLDEHRMTVLSRDGTTLASVDRRGRLAVWRVGAGSSVEPIFQIDPRRRVEHLALSPDGSWLVAGDRGDLYLFQVAGSQIRQPGFGGHVRYLSWSADGTRVAASGDYQMMVYDIPYYAAAHHVMDGGDAVALSRDGSRIACLRGDGRVELWEAGDPAFDRELDTEPPNGEGVRSARPAAAFSPDDRLVAVVDRFNRLTVWEAASGDRVLRLGDGELQQAADPRSTTSADGRLEARVSPARVEPGLLEIIAHDPGGERVVYRSSGLESPVRSLAFSPDGRRLATGHANGVIWVWAVVPSAEELRQ